MIRRYAPLALVAMLTPTTGCTILDLWDSPVVVVDDVPCDEDTDCESVRYSVPDDIASEPCIVPRRTCNTEAGRCDVALEARDSDGDRRRDMACAGKAPQFAPREVDCNDLDADAYPGADLDKDGFVVAGCSVDGQPEDCDDTRATAFPGQTIEACDGVVSTCTDITPPARRREEDFDDDRFSAVGLADSVCDDVVGPGGALLSFPRTDCDDADPLVYPDAEDVCDGRDNDCNSALGVGIDPREDFDGDGFAPPSSGACKAGIPGGFPTTDCDDDDDKTYPGAPDSCDLTVNDCNKRVGTNFTRSIEDPDGDEFFAGDADCIDPVVNIECSGAGFDPFAQYCAPRLETSILSGGPATNGTEVFLTNDFDHDGIFEFVYVQSTDDCAGDRLAIRYSFPPAAPLSATDAACVPDLTGLLAAEVDGDAIDELLLVAANGDVYVFDVSVAGSTMALTAKGGTEAAPDAVVVGVAQSGLSTAVAVGELDGTAGAELVARTGTSLVRFDLPADGVTNPAAVVIDASAAASAVLGVAIADLSSDGNADLVTFSNGSTVLRTYVATAPGTFGAPTPIDVATLQPGFGTIRSLRVGDLEGDADGDVDLVVVGANNVGTDDAFLLLANRSGSFDAVPLGLTVGGAPLAVDALSPTSIAVRDLEGDGKMDIVYASQADDAIGYLSEVGSNLFVQHVAVSDFDSVKLVESGDFDGDGDADLIGYAVSQFTISTFTSTFVSNLSFAQKSVDRAFDNVADSAVGDVDRDGRLDVLAMSALPGGEIHVWRSRSASASAFDEVTAFAAGAGRVMTAFAVGDGNADDRIDLGVVFQALGVVGFVRGNGDTTFDPIEELETFDKASDVEMADLDGDGAAEMVVTSNGGTAGRVAIYARPLGATTYTRQIVATGTAACVDAFLGDVDQDGDLDIAVACLGDGLVVLLNPFVGAGGGWTELVLASPGTPIYRTVALGDLDRDGDADLVASRQDVQAIAIQRFALGVPLGALDVRPISVGSTQGAELRIVDLDRDGDADIVVAGRSSGSAIRALQAVDASRARYVTQTILASAALPTSLSAGDLDGDGDPDVVATIRNDADVLWWTTGGTPWWDH